MVQYALNIIVPVRKDQVAALKKLLDSIGRKPNSNPHIRFVDMKTVHFMRWVVLDNDLRYAPVLACETNYDGPFDAHIADLVRCGAQGLDLIYSHCEGYPAGAGKDAAAFQKFVEAHAPPTLAFHIAYRGHSVQNVRNDARIRDEIQKFLDQRGAGSFKKLSATQIHAEIRKHLATVPGLDLTPYPDTTASRNLKEKVVTTALLIAALVLLPVLIPWAILLRLKELHDDEHPGKPLPDQHLAELIGNEDHVVQNQLTHLVDIKPGLFRLVTLRLVLWAINVLAKYKFNQGSLGGIPTIHFARWLILDNKRLLFFSNFDGTWENYLGDFIDKASKGLTGVWSNSVGFPKTLLLVFRGALNEQLFKLWTRDHQIHTQVWYSAHPRDSVQNVLNSIPIRDQVNRNLSEEEARAWLVRLGL